MESPRYTLEFKPNALENLSKIPKKSLEMIRKAISKKLSLYPDHYGERLHGKLHGFFKLRVDMFRVIYTINVKEMIVTIYDIDFRRDIYQKYS